MDVEAVDKTGGTMSKPLNVALVLDVSYSMSSQIEAMKRMLHDFCLVERPGVTVRVVIFSEDPKFCGIEKSPPNATVESLLQFVDHIELCQVQGRMASGGDGPENSMAALYSLVDDYTASDNVLCFLITDSPPHHRAYGTSSEAQAERDWLEQHHAPTDVFEALNAVLDQLNITIVPILFNGMESNAWHQQAARVSESLILLPNSHDSALLARGLGAIMHALQQMSTTRRIDPTAVPNLQGFSIVVPDSDAGLIEADPDREGLTATGATQLNSPADIEAALLGLLNTACDRFSGKRAGKRCRTVGNPSVIAELVRFLVNAMLYISESPQATTRGIDVDRLRAEATVVKEEFDKDTRRTEVDNAYEKRLLDDLVADLDEMRVVLKTRLAAPTVAVTPVQCAVTLETAAEYLAGLTEIPKTEDEVSAWMEIVLQLTMCRLIDVSFPLDLTGKPDFADSWSAVIKDISFAAAMSASAAAKLRKEMTYKDPHTRRNYSSALITSHPNDPVLSTHFSALSALPTLQGLVQGYLVSGGLRIFPSIVPGLQASTLLTLVRHSVKSGNMLSQAQWDVARCIVHSLKESRGSIARDIVKALKDKREFNPADGVPKLVAGLVIFLRRNGGELDAHLVTRLFEEMSAGAVTIATRIRERAVAAAAEAAEELNAASATGPDEKYHADGLPTDSAIAACLIPTSWAPIDATFDAVAAIHPAEQLADGTAPMLDTALPALYALIAASSAFHNLKSQLNLLVQFLVAPLENADVDLSINTAATQALVPVVSESVLANAFLESVLLKKRSGRFDLDDTDKKTWTRKPMVDIVPALRSLVREEYTAMFRLYSSQRAKHAHTILVGAAAAVRGDTPESCETALKEVSSFSLLGRTYPLSRMDAPEVLKSALDAVAKQAPEADAETLLARQKQLLSTLGVALVIGREWSTDPPSILKRQKNFLEPLFANASAELWEQVMGEIGKQAVCMRVGSPNRHGHTAANRFPGFCGWTAAYDAQRIADFGIKIRTSGRLAQMNHRLAHIRARLDAMKKWAQFCEAVRTERWNELGNARRRVVGLLMEFPESQEVAMRLKPVVEKVLVDMSLDGERVEVCKNAFGNARRFVHVEREAMKLFPV